MLPEKPKLSEIAHAIELLECWSLFDNSGGEIRQSLKPHTLFRQTLFRNKKAIENTRFFQKALKILLFYKEKTYVASYSKSLLLFHTLVL